MSENARLALEPEDELRFKGPFNNVVTTHLKLSNPSDRVICFKVKTTAPKRYCVRPNCGYIRPSESADVSVMLQPFNFDPQERNKHKFMVQSVVAPEGDDLKNLDALFKSVPPSNIVDCKLRCVLEDPSSQESKIEKTTAARQNAPPVATTPRVPDDEAREVNKLQVEIARLSDDNSRLREQEFRLKKLIVFESPDKSRNSSDKGLSPKSNSRDGAMAYLPPILYLMLAFILGLLLGKFIL
jgi:hypothetical protein